VGFFFFRGYSDEPSAQENTAYLEPNSQSMQKPIGGRSNTPPPRFK
jgi:hypothetical protein